MCLRTRLSLGSVGARERMIPPYFRKESFIFLVWGTGSLSTRGKSGSEASVASRKGKSLWTLWTGRAHSLETFRPQELCPQNPSPDSQNVRLSPACISHLS